MLQVRANQTLTEFPRPLSTLTPRRTPFSTCHADLRSCQFGLPGFLPSSKSAFQIESPGIRNFVSTSSPKVADASMIRTSSERGIALVTVMNFRLKMVSLCCSYLVRNVSLETTRLMRSRNPLRSDLRRSTMASIIRCSMLR